MTMKMVSVSCFFIDVKSVFFHGDRFRYSPYIEVFCQDSKFGDAVFVGCFQKVLYGIRDASQIWAKEVQKVMEGLGFVASMFQPSEDDYPAEGLLVVGVDDCSGR